MARQDFATHIAAGAIAVYNAKAMAKSKKAKTQHNLRSPAHKKAIHDYSWEENFEREMIA